MATAFFILDQVQWTKYKANLRTKTRIGLVWIGVLSVCSYYFLVSNFYITFMIFRVHDYRTQNYQKAFFMLTICRSSYSSMLWQNSVKWFMLLNLEYFVSIISIGILKYDDSQYFNENVKLWYYLGTLSLGM